MGLAAAFPADLKMHDIVLLYNNILYPVGFFPTSWLASKTRVQEPKGVYSSFMYNITSSAAKAVADVSE